MAIPIAGSIVTRLFGRAFAGKIISGILVGLGVLFGGFGRSAPSGGAPGPFTIILYIVLGIILLKIIMSILR